MKITNPEDALLHLYRTIGQMRSETYRTQTDPGRILKRIEDIGTVAQHDTTDLFHSIVDEKKLAVEPDPGEEPTEIVLTLADLSYLMSCSVTDGKAFLFHKGIGIHRAKQLMEDRRAAHE